jgi:predicted enzyme involved in methoxymalonyl-ACP biosynthesis
MLKVEGYRPHDEVKVVDFIRKVQIDVEPDREVLSCSVLIKDDEDIVGMVSYESHGDMGVVRYFLYDARIAGTDIAVSMFFELYKKAHNRGVKQLIAQVPNREVGMLFEMLGFRRVASDFVNFPNRVKKGGAIMLINLEGKLVE